MLLNLKRKLKLRPRRFEERRAGVKDREKWKDTPKENKKEIEIPKDKKPPEGFVIRGFEDIKARIEECSPKPITILHKDVETI